MQHIFKPLDIESEIYIIAKLSKGGHCAVSSERVSLAISILFITEQTGLDESMENYKNLQWCSSANTPFALFRCSGRELHR